MCIQSSTLSLIGRMCLIWDVLFLPDNKYASILNPFIPTEIFNLISLDRSISCINGYIIWCFL